MTFMLNIVLRMVKLKLFSPGLGQILQEVFMLEEYLGFLRDVVQDVSFGYNRRITGWMKQLHQTPELKVDFSSILGM